MVQTLTRRNWVWVVAATAVVAAIVGAVIGVATGIGSQHTIVEKFFPNQSVLSNPSPGDIQAVLSKVEPAVVSIDTTQVLTGRSGEVVEGAGTGMILTADGEVLTNNHVVAGASDVEVTLFGQTQSHNARVIGTDPSEDLALVQIQGVHDLPTVALGDSTSMQVGDSVIAIGNALALQGGPTVTDGIVSATGRSLSAQSDFSSATENLTGLIQTDAPINPGNSGGPLVNSRGLVIGMNTAVATSSAGNAPAQNIGFAIAINSIKSRLGGLRAGGTGGSTGGVATHPLAHRAYMGINVITVTPAIATADHLGTQSGALVQSLVPGPAESAGIRAGDVVVAVGLYPVKGVNTLVAALTHLNAGQRVPVTFYRGADRMTVSVTLAAAP